jgi:hypothetical protein
MPERPPPDECANCGAAIPRHARACPECGADERTGWRDTSLYDGLDLPDSAFDEDATGAARPSGPQAAFRAVWFWIGLAAALLALFVLSGFVLP